MSELPNGWKTAEIGDLCNLINGRAFKPQEWGETGLPIIRIQNLNNQKSKFNYFSGDLDSKHLISNGDLLFAWSGTPGTSFGAHIWHGPDAALNQHIFKIEFSEECIERNFLRYAIDQKLDELIGSAQGGVGLRHVTKGTFEKTAIAFPPRAEQTRIAQKLDELLAQVDTLKARIDTIPALLNRFRQSVLAAAVSGRLTEEWRSDPKNCQELTPELFDQEIKSSGFKAKAKGDSQPQKSEVPGWLKASFGNVFSVRSGDGLTAKKMDDSGEIPVYGGNGVNGHHTKHNISSRSVVIGRVGYYCGSVHFTPEKAWITDNALIVNYPQSLFDINYIYWLLSGTDLRKNTASSAQPVISGEKIYPIELQVPPLPEQTEIVRRVEQLFAFADQLEAKITSAKSRIDHLTQSILAKAFRGELVSQDPNDEPAGALLQRIKTQRAAAPNTKRGRKSA